MVEGIKSHRIRIFYIKVMDTVQNDVKATTNCYNQVFLPYISA